MIQNNLSKILLVFISVFAILIFMMLVFCFPSTSDDLSRQHMIFISGSSVGSYLSNLSWWHQEHNGRIVNAIICMLPFLYKPYIYGLANLLINLIFIFSLYKTAKSLSITSSLALTWALFFYVLIYSVSTVPTIFYSNFSTTSVYLFSLAFCLLSLCEWNKAFKQERIGLAIYIYSFLSIGSLEIMAIPILLFLITAFFLKKNQKLVLFVYTSLFIAIIIYILSNPGNHVRGSFYPNAMNLGYSFNNTLATFFAMYASIFSSWSLMLSLALSYFLFAYQSVDEKEAIKLNPYTTVLVLLSFSVFIGGCLFAFYLGKGKALNPRYEDFLIIVILLQLSFFLLVMAQKIKLNISKNAKGFILSSCILLLMINWIGNKNFKTIIGDISSGDLFNARNENYLIQDYIYQNRDRDVLIYPKHKFIPKSLMKEDFISGAFKYHYGFNKVKKSNKHVEHLIK